MQVFIVGSVIDTVKILDPKRFNKQIIETKQILSALKGETSAWKNHPCTLQYRGLDRWLELYLRCFEEYKNNNYTLALSASILASEITPIFHTDEYFNQMKRRLFTKDNKYYFQWQDLGQSDVNWYFVDNKWRFYKNGKRILC